MFYKFTISEWKVEGERRAAVTAKGPAGYPLLPAAASTWHSTVTSAYRDIFSIKYII